MMSCKDQPSDPCCVRREAEDEGEGEEVAAVPTLPLEDGSATGGDSVAVSDGGGAGGDGSAGGDWEGDGGRGWGEG